MRKKNCILLFLLIVIILLVLFLKKDKPEIETNTTKYAVVSLSDDNNVLSNVENPTNKVYTKYQPSSSKFLTPTFEKNNLSVKINDSAKELIESSNANININSTYEVEGISENIKDVFVGYYNSISTYPVLFVLYNDNTAQYVDIEKSFKSGSFSIEDSINIDNIDYFLNVNVSSDEGENYIGVVAIDTYGIGHEITPDMIGQ